VREWVRNGGGHGWDVCYAIESPVVGWLAGRLLETHHDGGADQQPVFMRGVPRRVAGCGCCVVECTIEMEEERELRYTMTLGMDGWVHSEVACAL